MSLDTKKLREAAKCEAHGYPFGDCVEEVDTREWYAQQLDIEKRVTRALLDRLAAADTLIEAMYLALIRTGCRLECHRRAEPACDRCKALDLHAEHIKETAGADRS